MFAAAVILKHVGTWSARPLRRYFGNVTREDWATTSRVNGSVLRYLVLSGAYRADVPLRLPSLFVLQLHADAVITPAANLTLDNTTTFTGLVEMVDAHYSAVLGGTVDASSLPAAAFAYPYRRGYQAVVIKGGSNNAIRGVTARANNSDGALGVNESPHAEVAFCDVGGGAGGQGLTKGRCIWCLATSHALVHDNFVRNCSSHALDFDAFTSASAAYVTPVWHLGPLPLALSPSHTHSRTHKHTPHAASPPLPTLGGVRSCTCHTHTHSPLTAAAPCAHGRAASPRAPRAVGRPF